MIESIYIIQTLVLFVITPPQFIYSTNILSTQNEHFKAQK